MSRWLIGMSGDKDKMIAHLEKCEKRMLEQFAEIRAKAMVIRDETILYHQMTVTPKDALEDIIELCDVYLDKRNDKQKMQDQIDEMQKTIEELMEYKKEFLQRKEKEKQLRSDIGEALS